MPVNYIAENVLGTVGTVCWSGQLIPQNWKNWREHSTEGLSTYLVFLWAVSAIFSGIYYITQNINVPIIVQPQLFGFLCALSWCQCLYYSHKRSFRFCAMVLASFCVIGGGFLAGMVFLTKRELQKGNIRPLQFFGVLSSVITAIGLIPQYWEIWKRKEVLGVSYFFMTIDMSGAVFFILSLTFKTKFDGVAAAAYSVVLVMDAVILVAAIILNPRARRRRERAQNEVSTLQDVTCRCPTFSPQEQSESLEAFPNVAQAANSPARSNELASLDHNGK